MADVSKMGASQGDAAPRTTIDSEADEGKSRGPRRDQAGPATYILLLFLLSGMVLPLLWTFLTSFKHNVDVTLGWIPPRWTLDNYVGVVEAFSFLRYYLNSLFIACAVTLVQVATSVMAAYAFARMEFAGRNFLFTLLLATMPLPTMLAPT